LSTADVEINVFQLLACIKRGELNVFWALFILMWADDIETVFGVSSKSSK